MHALRPLLTALLLTSAGSFAHAHNAPKKQTTAQAEACNETATPSFSLQHHAAQRVTTFLADALLLSAMQQQAVLAATSTLRQAQALAATADRATQAEQEYLLAVRRVLARSQLQTYAVLVQQCSGTMHPLLPDGPELAVR